MTLSCEQFGLTTSLKNIEANIYLIWSCDFILFILLRHNIYSIFNSLNCSWRSYIIFFHKFCIFFFLVILPRGFSFNQVGELKLYFLKQDQQYGYALQHTVSRDIINCCNDNKRVYHGHYNLLLLHLFYRRILSLVCWLRVYRCKRWELYTNLSAYHIQRFCWATISVGYHHCYGWANAAKNNNCISKCFVAKKLK